VFSVIEPFQDRLASPRSKEVDAAIQKYLEQLSDFELSQVAMDLLHEYSNLEATESGKREPLREGRAMSTPYMDLGLAAR
jgi:hypothetical protein